MDTTTSTSPEISRAMVPPDAQLSRPSTSSMKTPGLILGAVLLLFAAAGAGYVFGLQQGKSQSGGGPISVSPTPLPPEGVACTMEAKMCPDGSAVGRSGPNCEFAECPAQTMTVYPLKYSNTLLHYSFSYPEDWVVTTENYRVAADPQARSIRIFNPASKPSQNSFNGISIESVGMLQTVDGLIRTTQNGMTMFRQDTIEGVNYFVNIPDTDAFLYVTGIGGDPFDSETSSVAKNIFASFRVTSPVEQQSE